MRDEVHVEGAGIDTVDDSHLSEAGSPAAAVDGDGEQ